MVLFAAILAFGQALAQERDVGSAPRNESGEQSSGEIADGAAMDRFLDRLMLVESGGRDDARNPRSTAVGPYQFIESTFLEVARRHFNSETVALTSEQILQLRMNRAFSRRAAEAFTRDNAAQLAAAGIPPTFINLRLAFLVGPGGAVRILKAEPKSPAIAVLGAQVVQANPFMAGMTASDLARWSARNLAVAGLGEAKVAADQSRAAAAPAAPVAHPGIVVRCKRALASCRRWFALATKRMDRRQLASTRSRNARR